MTKLSVNLNKVALLRNSRTIGIPNVLDAARTCIEAGAHGITVHPRPDQRHITPADVYRLAELLAAFPTVEFNIEGNPFPEFMSIVRRVKPTQCTLVPDEPNQRTSDHGWDLAQHGGRLSPIVQELRALGIRISLFMDPDPTQIARVADVGAERIELYTESYARAYAQGNAEEIFQQFARAAARARELGMGINAGLDLNLRNLPRFCTIPGILEVSIGHALISDTLQMGLASAVTAYLRALGEGSN